MIHQTLQWASQAMRAKFHGKDASVSFLGVSTDTRELKPGEIFFCLIGSNDGHRYAAQALEKRAAAVVIDEAHLSLEEDLSKLGSVLIVRDTLKALGDLAHAWRKTFDIPVVAITGSNGKTTTKELTAAILSQKFQTLATEGNLNNLIGVPKTLFRLSRQDEVAVVEMGMNDFGEIARLTEITRPTLGLITNIGEAHIERLGSVEGIAKAKGELFAGLTPEALALVNLADPRVAALPSPARRVGYGTPGSSLWGRVLPAEDHEDLRLKLEVCLRAQKETLVLALVGSHLLLNVLAALAIADQLGIDLALAKKGLEQFRSLHSRMEILPLPDGSKLIDDCYNANPTSTKAALQTLADLSRGEPTLAVLGEMLEMGKHAPLGHREVGGEAARLKIARLIAIGDHAEDILAGAREGGMPAEAMEAFPNVETSLSALKVVAGRSKWILIKGSRGAHLERAVQYLRN